MVDSIRVFDPGFRILDTSGNPISGAKLKFYNAGGLVARTVYSDLGLSTSLGSTVTCNASGVPCASAGAGDPVLIHTGTTNYKLIIKDSTETTTYFEFDNIPGALDTAAFGLDTATPVTPVIVKSTNYTVLTTDQGKVINADPTGGAVTLTLPSAVTAADDWRVTVRHNGTANSVIIEGVSAQTINGATSLTLSYQFESVTLVSDGANWHVTEDAFTRYPAGTVTPQGRLTLTTGVPVIISEVTAGTAVYYTPYTGNLVPLYNGLRFVPYEFSELTLTLAAQHVASSIYDIFAFLDGTTLRIGTGPAWSTVTIGSGARGTGAGTTQLTRTNGLLLNAVAMTARNGSSTYSVGASRATYLGSMYMDGTNGQVSCHLTIGTARKWSIFNAYNRVPVSLVMAEGTATYTYDSATFRASNGNANAKVSTFFGLAEEALNIVVAQNFLSAATRRVATGVGLNSQTTVTGMTAKTTVFGAAATDTAQAVVPFSDTPKLGINEYFSLESVSNASSTTFEGDSAGMRMAASFRA